MFCVCLVCLLAYTRLPPPPARDCQRFLSTHCASCRWDYVTIAPRDCDLRGSERVVPAWQSSAVVGGLTPGAPYTFTVQARSANGGWGPLSDPSTAVTPTRKASDPLYNVAWNKPARQRSTDYDGPAWQAVNDAVDTPYVPSDSHYGKPLVSARMLEQDVAVMRLVSLLIVFDSWPQAALTPHGTMAPSGEPFLTFPAPPAPQHSSLCWVAVCFFFLLSRHNLDTPQVGSGPAEGGGHPRDLRLRPH